jgi:hypothetical protein
MLQKATEGPIKQETNLEGHEKDLECSRGHEKDLECSTRYEKHLGCSNSIEPRQIQIYKLKSAVVSVLTPSF